MLRPPISIMRVRWGCKMHCFLLLGFPRTPPHPLTRNIFSTIITINKMSFTSLSHMTVYEDDTHSQLPVLGNIEFSGIVCRRNTWNDFFGDSLLWKRLIWRRKRRCSISTRWRREVSVGVSFTGKRISTLNTKRQRSQQDNYLGLLIANNFKRSQP